MEFVSVKEKLPVKPGEYSKKLFVVLLNEFGFQPMYAFATCWISALHPDDPKWYLPAVVYGLDKDQPIALEVTHYCELPQPTDVLMECKP